MTSDGSEVTSPISTATLSGGNGDNTDTASTPGASNSDGGAGGIVTTITTGSEIITSTLTGPVTSTSGSVTVTETSVVGSETTTATASDGDESSGTETESDGSASETGDSDDAGVRINLESHKFLVSNKVLGHPHCSSRSSCRCRSYRPSDVSRPSRPCSDLTKCCTCLIHNTHLRAQTVSLDPIYCRRRHSPRQVLRNHMGLHDGKLS